MRVLRALRAAACALSGARVRGAGLEYDGGGGRAVRGVDAELAREQGTHGTSLAMLLRHDGAEADVDSRGHEVGGADHCVGATTSSLAYDGDFLVSNSAEAAPTSWRRQLDDIETAQMEPKLDPWRREPVFSSIDYWRHR